MLKNGLEFRHSLFLELSNKAVICLLFSLVRVVLFSSSPTPISSELFYSCPLSLLGFNLGGCFVLVLSYDSTPIIRPLEFFEL